MATVQDVQSKLDEAKALVALIPAAPASSSAPTPASAPAWPAAVDCLGGTAPSAITIPTGDGDPTGRMGEPGYSRRLANMPDGSIGVFGDSIIQATPENLIHPAAVNYALGGQSLRRMVNSLRDLPFMRTAGAGVILCGVNDLGNVAYYGPRDNGSAVGTVLIMFSNHLKNWLTGKWVVCHLLPTTAGTADSALYKAQVDAVNTGLSSALAGCAAQIAYCPVPPALLDANGYLKTEMAMTDGQHLNKAGSALLASGVRAALSSLGL